MKRLFKKAESKVKSKILASQGKPEGNHKSMSMKK